MSLLQIKKRWGRNTGSFYQWCSCSVQQNRALCLEGNVGCRKWWRMCSYSLWFGERKDECSGSNHKCLCLCAYADVPLTLANSYRWTQGCPCVTLWHKRPQRDEQGGLCSLFFLVYTPRNLGTSSSQVICQRSPRGWIGLWPFESWAVTVSSEKCWWLI